MADVAPSWKRKDLSPRARAAKLASSTTAWLAGSTTAKLAGSTTAWLAGSTTAWRRRGVKGA